MKYSMQAGTRLSKALKCFVKVFWSYLCRFECIFLALVVKNSTFEKVLSKVQWKLDSC